MLFDKYRKLIELSEQPTWISWRDKDALDFLNTLSLLDNNDSVVYYDNIHDAYYDHFTSTQGMTYTTQGTTYTTYNIGTNST
jgi:hypothetical protein